MNILLSIPITYYILFFSFCVVVLMGQAVGLIQLTIKLLKLFQVVVVAQLIVIQWAITKR